MFGVFCAESVTGVALWICIFFCFNVFARILSVQFLASDDIKQDGRCDDTGALIQW